MKATLLILLPLVWAAPSLIIDDSTRMLEECVRLQCKNDLCYVTHPTDCFKYIMCESKAGGGYYAKVMPCPFGTMWKSGPNPSCESAELMECLTDRCRTSNLTSYSTHNNNCRTYWTCNNYQSLPACCPRFYTYDSINKACVKDISCDGSCPLINDASCENPAVTSIDLPDGNCKTYFDCTSGQPHPFCCPDGTGYDVFTSSCSPDVMPKCTQQCPNDYIDMCRTNASSFDIHDGNCRTYMKCNNQGLGDPHCCFNGRQFDLILKKCVPASGIQCQNAPCPYGYKEECRLVGVPGNPSLYRNLDAHVHVPLMPCAVGTFFQQEACRCVSDNAYIDRGNQAVRECAIAIHAKLPNLRNLGFAAASLLMIGDYGQGERGVGNMSALWDGNDGINIPYYGSQSPIEFYLQIKFKSPVSTIGDREILMSGCNYRNGVPTLEVSVMRYANLTGQLRLLVANSNLENRGDITFEYQLGVPYTYTVIYDGKTIGAFLVSSDRGVPPQSDRRPFSGEVPITSSGLRFARCRDETGMSFIGEIEEIKFSKCINSEMQSTLDSTRTISTP